MTARLNVNIDHVATVLQARSAPEPSVVAAALVCEGAGADGITIHLRGDRRHIPGRRPLRAPPDRDDLSQRRDGRHDEMLRIAADVRPDCVTLVAENPGEITTEGGLDARANFDAVRAAVERLHESGIASILS